MIKFHFWAGKLISLRWASDTRLLPSSAIRNHFVNTIASNLGSRTLRLSLSKLQPINGLAPSFETSRHRDIDFLVLQPRRHSVNEVISCRNFFFQLHTRTDSNRQTLPQGNAVIHNIGMAYAFVCSWKKKLCGWCRWPPSALLAQLIYTVLDSNQRANVSLYLLGHQTLGIEPATPILQYMQVWGTHYMESNHLGRQVVIPPSRHRLMCSSKSVFSYLLTANYQLYFTPFVHRLQGMLSLLMLDAAPKTW